jgi:delta-aminolevulinic acid dehydratase/porphobilinogen synthase
MRLPRKKNKLKIRAMKSERLLFTSRLIFPFFVSSKLRYGIGLVHRALAQRLQKY